MLAHNVYFRLHDASPAALEALLQSCHHHLSGHLGEVFYASGTLDAELDREVNDQDWDVALVVVFRDRQAHDTYQTSDRHLAFIAENKANFKVIRVFDGKVEAA